MTDYSLDACNNYIAVDASSGTASSDVNYTGVLVAISLEDCNEHLISYSVVFPSSPSGGVLDSSNTYLMEKPTATLYKLVAGAPVMITTVSIPESYIPDRGILGGITLTAPDLSVAADLTGLQLYLEFNAELSAPGLATLFVNSLSTRFNITTNPNDLIVQVLTDDAEENYIDGIPLRIINPNALAIREAWVKLLTVSGLNLQSKVYVLNKSPYFPIVKDASSVFQFNDNMVQDQLYYVQVKALYEPSGGTYPESDYTAPIEATFSTRVGKINIVSLASAFDEDAIYLPNSVEIQFTLPFDATRYGRTVDTIVFSHNNITIDSPFTSYSTPGVTDVEVNVADLAVDESGVYTYIFDHFTDAPTAVSNFYASAYADTRYGKVLEVEVPENTRSSPAVFNSLSYTRVNQASDFDGTSPTTAPVDLLGAFSLQIGSRGWPFIYNTRNNVASGIRTLPFDVNLADAEFPFTLGATGASAVINSLTIEGITPLTGTFRAAISASADPITGTPYDGAAFNMAIDGGTAYEYQIPPTAVSAASITNRDSATKDITIGFTKGVLQQTGAGTVYTRVGLQDPEGASVAWDDTLTTTGTSVVVPLTSWLRNKTVWLQSFTADLNAAGNVYGDITTVAFQTAPVIASLNYVEYESPSYEFTTSLEQYGMENGQHLDFYLATEAGAKLYYNAGTLSTSSSGAVNPLSDSTQTISSNSVGSTLFYVPDDITNWGDFTNVSLLVVNRETGLESAVYRLRKENGSSYFEYTLMPVRSVVPDAPLTAADSIITMAFHMNADTTLSFTGVEAKLNYGTDGNYETQGSFSETGVNLSTFTASELITSGALDGGPESYVQMIVRGYLVDPNRTATTKIYSTEAQLTLGPVDFVLTPLTLTMVQPDRAPSQITYTVRTTIPSETSMNINALAVMTDAGTGLTWFAVSENTSYAIVVHKDASENVQLLPRSAQDLLSNILYVRQSNLDYTNRDLKVWVVSDASSAQYPTDFLDPSFNPALPANAKSLATTQSFRPYKQITVQNTEPSTVGGTTTFAINLTLNGDDPTTLTFVYFFEDTDSEDVFTYDFDEMGGIGALAGSAGQWDALPGFIGHNTASGVLTLNMSFTAAQKTQAIFMYGMGAGQSVTLKGYSFYKSIQLVA